MSQTIASATAVPTSDVVEEVPAGATVEALAPDDLTAEDLLVEDVSIDGMCGVY